MEMAKTKLIIVGASGHAKVIIDVFEQMGTHEVLGMLDDNVPKGTEILGYPLLGRIDEIQSILSNQTGVECFIAIGDNWTRSQVANHIQALIPGIRWANAIHPFSHIGKGVVLGKGIAVLAGAVINSETTLGDFTILGSNSSLDHECKLGEFASLGPGCTVGGNVQIGQFSTVALGANIIHGIKIGAHAVIGTGATVLENFADNLVIYGTPAKKIRTRTKGEKYL